MQVERSGDHRGKGNGRPYSSACIDTPEDECIELHGVAEGEERADDI